MITKPHIAMPLAMGAMVGLSLPLMHHSDISVGLGFVLAHVAVIFVVAALVVLLPRLRPALTLLRTHRPKLARLPLMGIGFGLGWGVVCVYCLAIAGEHH